MAADVAGFERDMKGISRSAKRELNKVSRELWKAERDLERARGKVRGLATTLGALGGVAIAGVGREFRKFAQEANALDKVSKTVSLTVEELQELRFAAEQAAGITSQTLDMAMQRFSRRVGEAANDTGELNTIVKELGVQLRNADGTLKSQTELLGIFADRIKNAESEQEALRIAFKLFDSEGARMVTLLREGSDAIEQYREQARRAGGIMSRETVQATVQFNDSLQVLIQQAKGVRNQIFGDLIGPLAEYVTWLAQTEEGQRQLNQMLERLGNVAKVVSGIIATRFTLSLIQASAEVVVLSARVAMLTRRKLALQGASAAAATATVRLGRVMRVATGPIGIAAGALAAFALSARDADDETSNLSSRVALLIEDFDALSRSRIQEAMVEVQTAISETADEIDRLEKKLERAQSGQRFGPGRDLVQFTAEDERRLQELREEYRRHTRQLELLGRKLIQVGQDTEQARNSQAGLSNEFSDTSRVIPVVTRQFEDYLFTAQDINEEHQTLSEWLDSVADGLSMTRREADAAVASFLNLANAVTQNTTGLPFFNALLGDQGGSFGGQDLGSNIARSVARGIISADSEGVFDALGRTLESHIIESVTGGFEETIDSLFGEDGDFAQALSDSVSLAAGAGLGAALGGGSEAASVGASLGTVAGQAAGSKFLASLGSAAGPLGAIAGGILGGLIGGLFDDSKNPRFDFGQVGPLLNRKSSVTPDFFDTALGEIAYGNTGLSDDQISQFVRGLQDFDRALATAIEGSGYGDAVREALESFTFISDEQGLSLDHMMEARLDAALRAVDGFVAELVKRGDTIEDQLQRLSDAFTIEREIFLGRGLGLPGADIPGAGVPGPGGPSPGNPAIPPKPGDDIAHSIQAFNAALQGTGDAADVTTPVLRQTLQIVEELSRPSETLAETFLRVRTIADSLDTAMALLGRSFDGTREQLIRFGDNLSQVFGDNVEALTGKLNRIFETFFSDEERFTVMAEQARQRATDLLTDIGLTVTEDMLTQGGFRQVFDDLFGTLSPENTALLVEAGNAIADLISAEERLAEVREDALQDAIDSREATREARRELSDFMDDIELSFLEAVSPARASLKRLVDRWAELEAQARELGATEQQLAMVRRAASAELARWISEMKLSTLQLAEDFFSAEQSFTSVGNAVAATAQNMRDTALRALGSIDEWLMRSQLDDVSPLTPAQRIGEAEQQFRDAFAAAMGGDFDALSELPSLADAFLGEAAGFFGTSTEQFRDIWDEVQAMMNQAADIEPPPEQLPPNAAQIDTLINTNSEFGQQIADLNEELTAWQLADQINALATAQEQTPAEIAAQLGFTDADMRQILSALGEDIPAGTEVSLRDHFNDVVSEIAEQNPLVAAIQESNLGIIDELEFMLGTLEVNLWAIGDVLVQILEQLGGTYEDFNPPWDEGVSTNSLSGEFVAPLSNTAQTTSNSHDFAEVKAELERISSHIERGNHDRRDGFGAVIREEQSTRRAIARKSETVRAV
jgi:hypothetical protein